jgi:iduronate 2-sulfatase
VLLLLACPGGLAVRAAESLRPNVLFIALDDLRPELGCYGAAHIRSPHIDRLSAQGVRFERAYCQWAICGVSRASLLTGLRPDSIGGTGMTRHFRTVVPDVVTLPQHFKQQGYFAKSFGKIFHGAWETAYAGDRMQDPVSWSAPRWTGSPQYYFSPDGMREAREVFSRMKEAKGTANDPDAWTRHFVRARATEAPDVPDERLHDGQMTVAAIEELRAAKDRKQPFFLGIGYLKPHLPFIAPKKYWDLYDPAALPSVPQPQPPQGAPKQALTTWGELRTYSNMPKKGPLSDEQTRHLRHGYAACVSYVDALIGRLLDELEALGLAENTIVVLWGDHGFKLGDLGMWCKHTNFEPDTRVPLIVRAPGGLKGGVNRSLVELVDLYPTLCELAALEPPGGLEGRSFAPLLRDAAAQGEDAAFSQYPSGKHMGYSVRTARWRYTEWRTRGHKPQIIARELYDFEAGGHDRNLADAPSLQTIRDQLHDLLP